MDYITLLAAAPWPTAGCLIVVPPSNAVGLAGVSEVFAAQVRSSTNSPAVVTDDVHHRLCVSQQAESRDSDLGVNWFIGIVDLRSIYRILSPPTPPPKSDDKAESRRPEAAERAGGWRDKNPHLGVSPPLLACHEH
ncbi:hypothetical protein SprV_1002823400 [Sparganum proliferum]